ncbi:MAG TPA: NAD(P)/FAD-dependent oxidoreductase [Polyangiales bacterium]
MSEDVADFSPAEQALRARVERELTLLEYPKRAWLEPRSTPAGQPILDVAIVGAGQGGLAAAFGLMRERVSNLALFDQNPLDRAGPWLNFARMHTLRTPKHVSGPDLGVPSLTPRAYFEATHGEGSWEQLGLIPRQTWAAYLRFYRRVLNIPVQPETQVGALRWEPGSSAFALPCTRGGFTELRYARRVILATGIEGSGAWQIPALIRTQLPRERYAHTSEPIDFRTLAGKRVAVLGAGASAFDNASVALEHGAREVHMFFRRSWLVQVNPYRWAEFVGFLRHHADLPDADRYRFIAQLLRTGQLPPTDTYLRATKHANFHLHPGSQWQQLRLEGEQIVLQDVLGHFELDFVIVGTGFVTDLALRPELAELEPHIARWQDRFQAAPSLRNAELDRHPYLGPGFEFCARDPGSRPELSYVFNYTFGGLLSLGFGGASISGMKYSIPRLVGGVTSSLYREDAQRFFDSLCAYDEKEF